MIEECGAGRRWPYIDASSIFKSSNFSYSRYVSVEFIQGSWCSWSYHKSPAWGISCLKNVEPDEDDQIMMNLLFSKVPIFRTLAMFLVNSFKGHDVWEATIRVPRGGYHDWRMWNRMKMAIYWWIFYFQKFQFFIFYIVISYTTLQSILHYNICSLIAPGYGFISLCSKTHLPQFHQ